MVASEITHFWDTQFESSEAAASEMDSGEKDILDRCVEFFGDVSNKNVLDIGCGLGRNSIALAKLGANVTAVDISMIAVEKLNRYAEESGLSIKGLVSDALRINDLGRFDFVVGSMILHHLEPFDAFCEALHAAMEPGGKAFFYENNAASRLLVWMRENIVGKLWVPKYGDADEFPLKPQEVDMLRRRFRVVQVFPELVFFGLASTYLFKGHGGKFLKAVDDLLYSKNILVRYSYRQILLIEKLKQ